MISKINIKMNTNMNTNMNANMNANMNISKELYQLDIPLYGDKNLKHMSIMINHISTKTSWMLRFQNKPSLSQSQPQSKFLLSALT